VKRYLIIISSCLHLLVAGVTAGASAAIHASPVQGKPETDRQQISRQQEKSREQGADFWRRANAEYELGRTSKNPQERSNHFHRAEDFARQSIKADPRGDEGYKWMAIALGAQAEDESVSTQIRLSRQVKENIDKALALDPDDDISLLVLSRWHYKVASLSLWTRALVRVVYGGLPSASMEKAAELQLRAIAIKDRIAHRYSLAKIYYQMGRREDALRQLRLALALPVTFPEEAEDLDKARRKLVRWK
jgi:tetratricopeptide (TPR) repeat protein